jgi:hypothetical protein
MTILFPHTDRPYSRQLQNTEAATKTKVNFNARQIREFRSFPTHLIADVLCRWPQ